MQNINNKLIPIINEQRRVFFDKRISEIKDDFLLNDKETKEIWNLFLAGEHPEYTNGRSLELLPEMINCLDEPVNKDISWCFHNFKWVWSLIWKDYQLKNALELSSRIVLSKEKQNPDLVKHPQAQKILLAELEIALDRVFKQFTLPSKIKEIDSLAEISEDNVFILDIKAADNLEILKSLYQGNYANDMIIFLRKAHKQFDINQRATSWKQPLFFYKIVAAIVWNDWGKKRVDLLFRKPPALPLLAYDNIRKPMKAGTRYDKINNVLMDINGNPITNIGREIALDVPSIELQTIQNILAKGNINTMSSINAHRLLRWEITMGTKQFIDGNPDARAIRVEGGFGELSKLIGAGSNEKSIKQVKEVVIWQAHSLFANTEGLKGNMLSYSLSPGGYRKKAYLTLILGDMMLPHFIFELLGIAKSKREQRKLIPIVDMPPLIGRSNEQGSQANFQMELMVKFRKHAQEFAEFGCVKIEPYEFKDLAKESGMTPSILKKVLDRWTKDGDDTPAFLKDCSEDRYALGDHHQVAQNFIIEGGKKELAMSKAGKKSVAKRKTGNF